MEAFGGGLAQTGSTKEDDKKFEQTLGDDNSVTTTVKPDESIDVEWKDDSWTANVNMPLDGTEIAGSNVNIKREINF